MKNTIKTIVSGILACCAFFSFASCQGETTSNSLSSESNSVEVSNSASESGSNGGSGEVEEVCSHLWESEGRVVTAADESGYVYVRECTLCGDELSEEMNVSYASDVLLYDENQHWNRVVGEAMKQTRSAGQGTEQIYKGNQEEHHYDEYGKCKDCHYKSSPSENLEYQETEDEEGYIVVGRGDCKDEHINIPNMHNGKPVIGIGDNAFKTKENEDIVEDSSENTGDSSEDVSSESTGDSSEAIPEEKPEENLRIIGITIPDTVVTISCTAFAQLTELNNFIVDLANEVFSSQDNCLINQVAKEVVRGSEFSIIPTDGSVTAIGSYAFAGCETLVSITIPESIEDIGDKAFFECEALVEVKLPDNVNIGVDVFRGSIHVEVIVQHQLEFVAAKDATCEEPGNIEHYKCTNNDHNELFADPNASERIYNVEIPAAHDFDEGVCTKCGKILASVLIVSVDTIPHLGKFALGTLEDAIGLPKQIMVTTADLTRHSVSVSWELSDYKKDTVGEYTIRGHIIAGDLHFADGVSSEVEATIEIVEYMQGTADIVFVLDATGSMGDEITNVKNNISEFAARLEGKGVSARWSVIDYRDFEEDPSEITHVIMNGASEWYTTAEEYATAIGSISVYGGGDFEEVAIDGLMLATTLETRKNARTFYILVTDATHKVANNYGVTNMNELAEILAEKDVNTSVIAPTGYYDDYKILATSTGGIMANIYGTFQDDLFNALVPIIENEVLE